jgi:hypothetical protein
VLFERRKTECIVVKCIQTQMLTACKCPATALMILSISVVEWPEEALGKRNFLEEGEMILLPGSKWSKSTSRLFSVYSI